MRRIKLLLILFTASFLGLSCQSEQQEVHASENIATKPPVNVLTVTEAHQIIQDSQEVLVIDVRTPEEYHGELGHIAGSRLLPVQEVEQWASEIADWKEKDVILVCRSGRRSGLAADYLRGLGHKRLYNVAGGMIDWNKQNLPVEKSTATP